VHVLAASANNIPYINRHLPLAFVVI